MNFEPPFFRATIICQYLAVQVALNCIPQLPNNGLPSELKSLFKPSVLLPSQELSTYRKWRKVGAINLSITGKQQM
uniref:Uncharacterized protein n=1 Tax=Pygocentrus nattereri TaxID=42514 RepID=A0A3B4BY72_PYGNA